MRFLFIIILISMYLSSCTKEKETTYYYKVTNSSEHKIVLNNYSQGSIVETTNLYSTNFEEYTYSVRGESGHSEPPFGDSVEVIFDDSLSIIHQSQLYNVIRNLKNNESYTAGEETRGSKKYMFEYHYDYIFTNEDYQEALDHQ